ncbi:MAG: acyltransferase family protein [Planctomycetaceae bacterium]
MSSTMESMSRGAASGRTPVRLMSLDALRGFDMFWIIGGGGLLNSLAKATGWPILEIAAAQTEHPEWNGFLFWDLIFPTFMFVAGVAMPYSLTARIERGEPKSQLYRRVFRRALLLIVLGLVVNGALHFDFANQRYPSVLGRIGLGYLFAALIVMNSTVRAQIVWTIGILVGYWAAMKYVPVPGFGAGDWYPGHNLVDYIDRNLLPGRLYKIVRDPEGLFSTIPAIATVLLGALAGAWLRRDDRTGAAKATGLAIAGLVSLACGLAWNPSFPINKNLWTSSFVLYAGGWSLLLLALFYLVIDVWQFRRWSFLFAVIGMNAITIYVAQEIIDFNRIAAAVLDKGGMHSILFESGGLALKWTFLYVLYRFGMFLKV